MPSSTSSSERIPERSLPARPWGTALALAVATMIILLGGWEIHLRDVGLVPAYRNTDGLWAIQRRRVDKEGHDRVVIIGSSRAMFGFNLDAWAENFDGERPIQLALEGTNPRGFLKDLANDPDFSSLVVVGVTPGLFFGKGGRYRESALRTYKKESPSQKLGQHLGMWLERYMAMLDFDFALFEIIKRQDFPPRDGVDNPFPVRKLNNMQADRQANMWEKLLDDPAYRQLARDVWAGPKGWDEPPPPERLISDEDVGEAIADTTESIAKIEAKGGQVVFVRMPSSGRVREREAKYVPRDRTWDRLMAESGVIGVHFEDYPKLQKFELPEWSHLNARDQVVFTVRLTRIIAKKLGQADAQ